MLLDLVEVAKLHSCVNLTEAFAEVLEEFGIMDKGEVFTFPSIIHMESTWNPWNPCGIPCGIHGINVG